MFDFIPLEFYTAVQYHVLFFIALLILVHAMTYNIEDQSSLLFFHILGAVLLIIYTLYIGLRPVSGRFFGDMGTYNSYYKSLQEGKNITVEKDYVFNYFMMACSRIMSPQAFFLLIDMMYILPCYWFSRRYFGKYWFFGWFMFIASLSFWSFGTNGIRNGWATSIFILGLCFYNLQKVLMYACFLLSFFIHSSLLIPIAAFAVAALQKNPRLYLYVWLASIPLSLIAGSFWESLFGSLGFEDRTSGYLTNNEETLQQFSQTGFRWDFVLYSASGIVAGYYFIFKKNIKDNFYIHLLGIYAIANAFWILVIRAAFSNRFAYLSWFLLAAVIAYPMLKYKIWKDQYRILGTIIFVYFLFTYIMFLKG